MIAKAAMCNQKYISLQKQHAGRTCIDTIVQLYRIIHEIHK